MISGKWSGSCKKKEKKKNRVRSQSVKTPRIRFRTSAFSGLRQGPIRNVFLLSRINDYDNLYWETKGVIFIFLVLENASKKNWDFFLRGHQQYLLNNAAGFYTLLCPSLWEGNFCPVSIAKMWNMAMHGKNDSWKKLPYFVYQTVLFRFDLILLYYWIFVFFQARHIYLTFIRDP